MTSKKTTRRFALITSISVLLPMAVQAESLWRRRSPQAATVFEDSRARREGDLLTIIINESTEVDNREDKALNKSSDINGAFDIAAATTGGFAEQAASADLTLGGNSSRNFSGGATYRNSREIQDRITVQVVSVCPNGNLRVAGNRTSTIAGETRHLSISGTVRPVDIGPDNTINSRFVADMQTIYEDSGQERHFTRQGWLSRKWNKIWPF